VKDGWRKFGFRLAVVAAAAAIVASLFRRAQSRRVESLTEDLFARYQEQGADRPVSRVTFLYPLDGTLFPPELPPPTFRWQDAKSEADTWLISLQFQDEGRRLDFLSPTRQWTPLAREWKAIKQRSRETATRVTVLGFRAAAPDSVLSFGRITVSTSRDEVGAPLFYREVNLPFLEAVKDPSRIRWRFGSIAAPRPPPVVLEGLPVCGNCHSFSRDGAVLGMDVDYANNKGSYVITPTAREMTLATSDIITWNRYREEDKEFTYGFLSQVSPDGRHVVSTVKDKSVFVPKPELAFSQLFFPIKGILAVYARGTKTFQALPGADDPSYVQSNPTWSPDGQTLVFARAPAYQLKHAGTGDKPLLSPEECAEFLQDGQPFQFDLYRIPFNDGRGGTSEPLAGASKNGRSNFFPKHSPDGKWIIFCQAKNYMLLQPDSELFIVPAAGGTARRLRANTGRMNSWHSWSPNGRWLVFSSKANTPYTQLFLTHLDEAGESTPPVVLTHLTAPDRAANIPEFVNLEPGAIARIRQQFVDDYSFARSAYIYESQGAVTDAIRNYTKALELNPRNVPAHQRLGFLLYTTQQKPKEGLAHTTEALRLNPDDGCAHHDLGMMLFQQSQFREAAQHLLRAVELLPDGFDARYNPADMRFHLGTVLVLTGDLAQSARWLSEAVKLEPKHGRAHHSLALTLANQGETDAAAEHYAKALQLQPDTDQLPELPDRLAMNFAEAGRFPEAITFAEKALALARKAGNAELARAIQTRLESYRSQR